MASPGQSVKMRGLYGCSRRREQDTWFYKVFYDPQMKQNRGDVAGRTCSYGAFHALQARPLVVKIGQPTCRLV